MAGRQTAVTAEQKEIAAQERIRSFLNDLYGEEQMLIVRNTTNGVVSIGFGKLGDEGGKAIERSKRPIVLTDEFPREVWTEAADFRRAVSKGWLTLVSKEEYDNELVKQRERANELARLAAQDESPKVKQASGRVDPFNDDPSGEPMVIDEDTAEMQPASRDKRSQQFFEYEQGEGSHRPEDNTGLEPEASSRVSSRALSFCESQKRADLTSNQAIKWLDDEEKILTDADLEYIITYSEFGSVKSVARRILADRG
jgi:hypothetical protein